MKIKAVIRYHVTPIRTAFIRKAKDKKIFTDKYSEEKKQFFTTGEYIRKVERIAEKDLISEGRREELLLEAHRADIVYNYDEEEANLND